MSRTSSLDEVGDIHAKPGSRKWSVAIADRLYCAVREAEADARNVRAILKTASKHSVWKTLGYVSFDAMLIKRIRMDEQAANRWLDAPKLTLDR